MEYINNIQWFILFLFLDCYVTSIFTLFNWKYYASVVLGHLAFFYIYLNFNDNQLKQELKQNFFGILGLFFFTLIIFGLNELTLKKNWIILNSFKKSEEFLLNIIENITVLTFVTDPDLTIILTNKIGFSIITKDVTVNDNPLSLQDFLKTLLTKEDYEDLISMVDVALNESKVVNKKFLKKENQQNSKNQQNVSNIFAITVSQVSQNN